MYKKLILLLATGVIAIQLCGCGSNKQESVEQESVKQESAVEKSAADSEDNSSDSGLTALVPVSPSQQYDDGEAFVYEKAEISCDLPKGFKPYAGDEGIYVYKSYPKDLSTISYVISEGSEDVTQKTQEEYAEALEADFYTTYGDDVPVTIEQYDKIKVDGRPGLKIRLHYPLKGTDYEQLIYTFFNGDETHILSFTQEVGNGWMEEFEKCGETIQFIATE